jgi:hypothetical protein
MASIAMINYRRVRGFSSSDCATWASWFKTVLVYLIMLTSMIWVSLKRGDFPKSNGWRHDFPPFEWLFRVFCHIFRHTYTKNSKHSNSCWPQRVFSHDTATFFGDDQAGRDDQTLVSRETARNGVVYTSIFVHHHQIIIAFNFFQVTSWIMIELWSETMWNRVDDVYCVYQIICYWRQDLSPPAIYLTVCFFPIPFTPVFLKT